MLRGRVRILPRGAPGAAGSTARRARARSSSFPVSPGPTSPPAADRPPAPVAPAAWTRGRRGSNVRGGSAEGPCGASGKKRARVPGAGGAGGREARPWRGVTGSACQRHASPRLSLACGSELSVCLSVVGSRRQSPVSSLLCRADVTCWGGPAAAAGWASPKRQALWSVSLRALQREGSKPPDLCPRKATGDEVCRWTLIW